MENIDAVGAFVARLEFESFARDRKTAYAVVRALEVVSEATRRLPADLKDRHPEIDWAAVAAAGNIYRHEYDAVDVTLIWHTAKGGLDLLRAAAATELKLIASDE